MAGIVDLHTGCCGLHRSARKLDIVCRINEILPLDIIGTNFSIEFVPARWSENLPPPAILVSFLDLWRKKGNRSIITCINVVYAGYRKICKPTNNPPIREVTLGVSSVTIAKADDGTPAMVAAVVPPIRAAAVFANASLLEMRESFGTENAKALNGIRDARVRAERRTMVREDRQDDYCTLVNAFFVESHRCSYNQEDNKKI